MSTKPILYQILMDQPYHPSQASSYETRNRLTVLSQSTHFNQLLRGAAGFSRFLINASITDLAMATNFAQLQILRSIPNPTFIRAGFVDADSGVKTWFGLGRTP